MFVLLFFPLIISTTAYPNELLTPIDVKDFSESLIDFVNSPLWHPSAQDLAEKPLVQDLLTQAPSVLLTQSGGIGGRGALFLRGSESRHTLFTIDGLRLNDPSNTDRQFDSSLLFSNLYQSVSLQLGPSPVLYGGDATGGVIELTPRRGPLSGESLLNVVGVSYGSFDTSLVYAQSDWVRKDHQGTVGVMKLKSQGFSRFNSDRVKSTEKDGAESTQIFQASSHKWRSGFKTDIYLQANFAEIEQDGFDGSGNAIDTEKDKTNNKGLQFIQTTYLKGESGQSWLKTGLSKIERNILTESQGSEFYQGEIRHIQIGQNVQEGKHSTTAGLNFEQERYKDKKTLASNDIASVFLQQKFDFTNFSFFAGLRGESHQRYGEFLAYESSLHYNPKSDYFSYLKYAQGYKSPSLYQLFAPDSMGSPVGNSQLDPELNKSLEWGVSLTRKFKIDFVVFQQDFMNLITYTNQGYANRGSLRVRGADLVLLSPEKFWGQVKLNMGVLDFSYYSKTPLRRPPSYGGAAWIKNRDKMGLELGLRYLAARRDNDFQGNEQKLSAYELINAKLRYSSSLNQDFIFSIGNLGNREYEDIWGYAVAPLNYTLSWNQRF